MTAANLLAEAGWSPDAWKSPSTQLDILGAVKKAHPDDFYAAVSRLSATIQIVYPNMTKGWLDFGPSVNEVVVAVWNDRVCNNQAEAVAMLERAEV